MMMMNTDKNDSDHKSENNSNNNPDDDNLPRRRLRYFPAFQSKQPRVSFPAVYYPAPQPSTAIQLVPKQSEQNGGTGEFCKCECKISSKLLSLRIGLYFRHT